MSSSVLVTVAFLELVTSAVNILKVRNYFLRIRIFWYYCGMLSCACSFILCDRSNSVTSGLQHICCADRCIWSLFIHFLWLATYLLYLIVSSSVLVTFAFLELVTSAVNILKVRNYFLGIRIFCYYYGMLSCACSFILCDCSNSVLKQCLSHLDCNILAVLIGVWSLFIHSLWLARYLLYLIVSSSVLVTFASLELVTSAVNILKVRNYLKKKKNSFLLLFWHAFMCLFIHSM